MEYVFVVTEASALGKVWRSWVKIKVKMGRPVLPAAVPGVKCFRPSVQRLVPSGDLPNTGRQQTCTTAYKPR